MEGDVIILDKLGRQMSKIHLHSLQISDIKIEKNENAFFTVSHDGQLIINSLREEYDDIIIPLYGGALTKVDSPVYFDYTVIEFYVGSLSGKVISYKRSWIKAEEKVEFTCASSISYLDHYRNLLLIADQRQLNFVSVGKFDKPIGTLDRPSVDQDYLAKIHGNQGPQILWVEREVESIVYISWLTTIQVGTFKPRTEEIAILYKYYIFYITIYIVLKGIFGTVELAILQIDYYCAHFLDMSEGLNGNLSQIQPSKFSVLPIRQCMKKKLLISKKYSRMYIIYNIYIGK